MWLYADSNTFLKEHIKQFTEMEATSALTGTSLLHPYKNQNFIYGSLFYF